MGRKNPYETGYFTNSKMERSFQRIFIKRRPFCSPETGCPDPSKLPSFILIEGGIMVLHEEAFRAELKAVWEEYEAQFKNDD